MRAVILEEGHKIALADVAEPALKSASDVVVRVSLAAICMTDVSIKRGDIAGIAPGSILGHEYVGVVEQVGRDVRRFKAGDRVASPPALSCGTCPACRSSLLQNCPESSMYGGGSVMSPMGLSGVHTELVRVPNADFVLTPIPDSVGDARAVLVGDMLNTGYHAAREAAIETADTLAVFGCGPVGLCAILAAWQFGPSRILAVDAFDNRLSVAERFGALPVDMREGDPVEQILAATSGEGVDVVLEASGSTAAFASAARLVKRYGTVSCVGLFKQPVSFPVQELIYKGVRVVMGLGNVAHLPKVMKLVEHGRIDPAPVGTHTFPLDEALEAYDLFENHKDRCLKVFLKP
jgi:threonine dehydrogenase-like Zn-dependent dehydrogenase